MKLRYIRRKLIIIINLPYLFKQGQFLVIDDDVSVFYIVDLNFGITSSELVILVVDNVISCVFFHRRGNRNPSRSRACNDLRSDMRSDMSSNMRTDMQTASSAILASAVQLHCECCPRCRILPNTRHLFQPTFTQTKY